MADDANADRATRRKALTLALTVAAEAGDTDTIATLAAELRELRREEQAAAERPANVIALDAARRAT